MTQGGYIANRNDDAAIRFGLVPPFDMDNGTFLTLLAADAVGNALLALAEQDEDDERNSL